MKFLYTLLFLITCSVSAQESLFFNGKIFTGNRKQPFANSILIRNQKIIAVGDLADVNKFSGKAVKKIDLEGGMVLPGLIDSHIHAIDGGETLTKPNLVDNALSIAGLTAYIKGLYQRKEGFTGDVLDIYGLNISTWSSLDSISAAFNGGDFVNTPVFLRGSDGHTAWANNALLKKAGIDQRYIDDQSETLKKYFKRLPNGQPTGFVAEDAVGKIAAVIPDQTNWKLAAEKAMEHLNSLGITAWLDPSAGNTRTDTSVLLNAYAALFTANKLNAHVVATIVADADADPVRQINMVNAIRQKYHHTDFRVQGFKIFIDGVVEFPTQTAALSKPYTGTGKSGVLMFDPANFARFATAADSAGLLVHVHAIGDRAVTETLNGFEKARSVNGNQKLPHSITHMQFVVPGDFIRFKALNILTSLQLLWAFGDVTTIDIVKPYVDPEIYRWQYPAKSLLDAGAIIAGASDWPVSSANPFEAIARAETRKGDLGVLDPKECLPRINMLYGYTIEAARVLWMDREIGSLETGKFADMILVDRDIFTATPEALAATQVKWTMFKGNMVFRK
ncbi:amidohydrolase [Flavihumibacter fluvii]|uniref:amidohydrolase n=1 Tax=Flavihumibacter fluvii TaxID=2838157 RepID=UPI001BDE1071|nr:amidohydrolase [Flavihumibacter fluvii]ULQ52235.1 amidohydrolase [Flavihumibacter fluvii]